MKMKLSPTGSSLNIFSKVRCRSMGTITRTSSSWVSGMGLLMASEGSSSLPMSKVGEPQDERTDVAQGAVAAHRISDRAKHTGFWI